MTTLEVLQLCLIGQRSGRIECSHRGIKGTLHVVGGQVIHSECGAASPEDAFFDLVGVPDSQGTFIPSEEQPNRTIFTQTDFLLMEAARRSDESSKKPLSAPLAPRVTQLTVISDPLPKVFELGESRVTLGRSLDNDIILSVDSVSGHHCELEKRERDYWISDLDSRNGTFVNNKRITEQVMIQPGDLIQIGAALLRCGSGEMTAAAIKRKTSRIHDSDTQDLRSPPRPHATEGTIRFQMGKGE